MAMIEINWHPGRKELRSFAVLWLIFFGVVGAVIAWRSGLVGGGPAAASWRLPIALWAAAVALPAVGLPFPLAIKPVYVAWMAAAFPIGWTVSHLLLGLTYFGMFSLVNVVFRLTGRDLLARRFDRGAATYWTRRAAPSNASQYFRQS